MPDDRLTEALTYQSALTGFQPARSQYLGVLALINSPECHEAMTEALWESWVNAGVEASAESMTEAAQAALVAFLTGAGDD